ncbi:hypothetical protein GJ744_009636 [Endocarpon pusillum]|uniref:Uncharacterized protein n=1 Tax=Endocarpon pusillum TaxID=364733 RepID=A0A8H7AIJ5_9EURO|nr:hypothetical protein GJ744_009636 [Endocarpon pusillum]
MYCPRWMRRRPSASSSFGGSDGETFGDRIERRLRAIDIDHMKDDKEGKSAVDKNDFLAVEHRASHYYYASGDPRMWKPRTLI